MDSRVAAIVCWSHRHRGAIAAIVLGAVAVSAAGTWRLTFDADVLSLLPHDSPVIQSFRTFLTRFGRLDQLYVVFTAPDGHAMSEYSDQIGVWVDGLRGAPEISRVDAGVADKTRDFSWLADHQLLLFRDRQLDEALRRLSPEGMPAAVAARRDLLTLPSTEVAELVRQDPAGLFDLMRDALGGSQIVINIGAAGTDGYVTEDGRSRLVIALPKRPPYDTQFARALDDRLHAIESAAAAAAAMQPRETDEEPLPSMTVQSPAATASRSKPKPSSRRGVVEHVRLAHHLPFLFMSFEACGS